MIQDIKTALITIPDTLTQVLRKRSVQYGLGGVIGSIVLLVLAYGGIVWYYYTQSRAFPHVSIASVAVGNKTEAEITEVASQQFKTFAESSVSFVTPERTTDIPLQTIEAQFDATHSAQKAVDFGKTGGIFTQIGQQWQTITGKASIAPVYSYNDQKLTEKIDEITQGLDVPPQSAKIDYADGQFIVGPSLTGKTVDKAQLHKDAQARLLTLSHEPITIAVIEAKPALSSEQAEKLVPALTQYSAQPLELVYEDKRATLDVPTILNVIDYEAQASGSAGLVISEKKLSQYITTFADSIDRPAKDALFTYDNGKVTAFAPSQDGLMVDRSQLAKLLTATILSGGTSRVVTVPVAVTKAKVQTDNANDLGIRELIAHGESNYRGSNADRVFNLTLATQRINGTLIAPGQEFSFNQAVGAIDQSTGYKQALVILSGRTVLGDGGGVCQVSTTVFRAALNAGLPITQRYAHAFRISYYENDMGPGYDATIYQPGVDFKFKNDTGHYVLLQAYVDPTSTKINVNFYGVSDGRQAVLSKPTYYSTSPAPPDAYIDDPTLPKGTTKKVENAVPGAQVGFTRTVTRNGETIISETFRSNYRPWQAVYMVGTKEGT